MKRIFLNLLGKSKSVFIIMMRDSSYLRNLFGYSEMISLLEKKKELWQKYKNLLWHGVEPTEAD